jgi:hypothetical protein
MEKSVSQSLPEAWESFPGAEIITKGLSDLNSGTESEEWFLLQIGVHRLNNLGFSIPALNRNGQYPEDQLYNLLSCKHGNEAHSKYNSLIRRLISFERTAERWCSRNRLPH